MGRLQTPEAGVCESQDCPDGKFEPRASKIRATALGRLAALDTFTYSYPHVHVCLYYMYIYIYYIYCIYTHLYSFTSEANDRLQPLLQCTMMLGTLTAMISSFGLPTSRTLELGKAGCREFLWYVAWSELKHEMQMTSPREHVRLRMRYLTWADLG